MLPGRISEIRYWASGSLGASSGAKAATTRKTSTMAAPRMATGSRRSRRNALRVSDRPLSPSGSAPARAARASMRSRLRSPRDVIGSAPVRFASSSDPHPRVEQAVGDVDQQVHQHVDDRQHEDEALQDGEVALADRVEQREA